MSGLTDVVERAKVLYDDDEGAAQTLETYSRRLHEPLRLAVAGMVKAGKSTLLNAIIGEQIAPTDAGECTKVITWYRYNRSARITMHLTDGTTSRMPVRRVEGALVLDLGSTPADEVAWIDVEWPAEALRSLVLIDTPGIASLSQDVSARSMKFLVPEESTSDADAILYLLRHIHASDVAFLESFRDTAAGGSQTVNAVALLSRADEIGSGRIDALVSAARIAERYRRNGELRALTLGCIPIAGLLAEGARTLTEREFAAFQELAKLDRTVRDRLLLSVDRFTRPTEGMTLSVATRRALLSRFGIFGVRLGAALVRAGARDSSVLADRLTQQSGLIDVQTFVTDQFRSRAATLKAQAVIRGVEALLTDAPREGSKALLAELESYRSSAHDLQELTLLAELRSTDTGLSDDERDAAERLVGGSGVAGWARLGLPQDSSRDVLDARAHEEVIRWRSLSESPLADRRRVDVCRTLVRSAEGIVSHLRRGSRSVPGTGATDVLLSSSPT